MTKVRLHSLNWYKQFNATSEISYKASCTYNVDNMGEVKIDIEIPRDLAEQLDAYGQKMLWNKIDKVKKD